MLISVPLCASCTSLFVYVQLTLTIYILQKKHNTTQVPSLYISKLIYEMDNIAKVVNELNFMQN